MAKTKKNYDYDTRQKREVKYCDLKGPVYLVGHNWCFEWYPADVEKVIRMYKAGLKPEIMMRRMKCQPMDLFMLLVDLLEQKRIEERPGMIWGTSDVDE